MSTLLHDIKTAAGLLLQNASGTPGAKTATVTGAALDFLRGDGRVTAIQVVGTVSGTTPTLAGKIQEADAPGGPWTDATGVLDAGPTAGPAAFAQVTASTNVQIITFFRQKRYVRYIGTIAGTTPSFDLLALILQQNKEVT